MNNDINPWPGLLGKAVGGEVTLAADAARTAAELAVDLLNSLAAVEAKVIDLNVHRGFSDNNHLTRSAVPLSGMFNKAGQSLGPILRGHREIVTNMGETFVAAGKLYSATEHDVKTAFDNLKKKREPGTHEPPPVAGKVTPPPLANPVTQIAPFAGAGWYSDPVDPENPAHHNAEWFVRVGVGINAQSVMDSSATWRWASKRIADAFLRFTEQLSKLREQKAWTGNGIDAAIRAATDYHNNMTLLTMSMNLISDNLARCASWLDVTKRAMPTTWNPADAGTAAEWAVTQPATLTFLTVYIPNVMVASAQVPKLPEARSTPLPPATSTTSSSNPGAGGNGSGSGGTGSDAGGTGSGPGGTGSGGGCGPQTGNGSGSGSGGSAGGGDSSKTGRSAPIPAGPTGPGGSPAPGSRDGVPAPSPGGDSRPADSPGGSKATDRSADTSRSNPLTNLPLAPQGMPSAAPHPTQPPTPGTRTPRSGVPGGKPGGGGGVGGGGGSVSPAAALLRSEAQSARLFPRATIGAEVVPDLQAGAPRTAMSGAPGMVPPGAAGMAGDGRREHRRAEYLESDEHLDADFGAEPVAVRPVIQR